MNPFGSCFSLNICPGLGLQSHMAVLFLVFYRTSILFSIVAIPIYIPTSSVGWFPSFQTSPEFIVSRIFDDGHSDQHEMMPHYGFDCIFLITNDAEHLFMSL